MTPVGIFVFTVWNITDCLISEINSCAEERRTLFKIHETLILPVVLYGFVALREQ